MIALRSIGERFKFQFFYNLQARRSWTMSSRRYPTGNRSQAYLSKSTKTSYKSKQGEKRGTHNENNTNNDDDNKIDNHNDNTNNYTKANNINNNKTDDINNNKTDDIANTDATEKWYPWKGCVFCSKRRRSFYVR